jgi:hypothetical protein
MAIQKENNTGIVGTGCPDVLILIGGIWFILLEDFRHVIVSELKVISGNE